jgi:hypothetical protein
MKNSIKKASKKELEIDLTNKFMQVVAELGHDAEKLKRVIKKASKFITKKIERKLKDVKHVVEAKLDPLPVKQAVKKAEKSAATPKKDIAKKTEQVEKVIAKATKVATKRVAKAVAKPEGKEPKAIITSTKLVKSAKPKAKPTAPKSDQATKAASAKAKTSKK